MKKYRVLIFAILGIAAIFACYWFFFRSSGKAVTVIETAAVKRASLSNSVTATGTVQPVKQVNVGTQVSGVIQKICVDFNSKVKKGQLLAELDKTPLLAQLASMKADLEAAMSAVTFQQANYNRMKELFDKKAISGTDYENALYQFNNAKANFTKMTSEVNKANTNLGYAMIYSPIDGVILSRAVDEGQTVAASFNTPTLFTIAQDLTKMEVIANVDEADIGTVKEGQKVTFTVDAYPDEKFKGVVKQVRLLAVTTSNVVTYSVVVDAPNPELKLKPGLTASITAFTQEVEDVLTIPVKALRFRPDSAMMTQLTPAEKNLVEQAQRLTPAVKTVSTPRNQKGPASDKEKNLNMMSTDTKAPKIAWVKEAETIHPVEVVTGMTDETNVEIKSGLKEGYLVVISIEQAKAAVAKAKSSSTQSPFMPKRPGGSKK